MVRSYATKEASEVSQSTSILKRGTVKKPTTIRDDYLLNRAMGLALSSKERHRHGAVVVKQGKILSWGVNVRRNHPIICTEARVESGIHAEVAAIRRANTSLEGTTLYVARINKKGKPLLSKPCLRCQAAIEKAGIKRVVYTESE